MEDFVTRNLSGGVWAHCHDVLHMTQLQNDIAQSSGLDPSVNCACVFLFGFVMCFRHSLILMVCVCCCADLVFWDTSCGAGRCALGCVADGHGWWLLVRSSCGSEPHASKPWCLPSTAKTMGGWWPS